MGGYPRSTVTGLTVLVRDALDRDLPAILKLELASFSDPWTMGMFSSHLGGQENILLVAELTSQASRMNEIVGFAVARVVAGEAELLNIAVLKEKRGFGVGSALLDQILSRSAEKGAECIYLEVRESNNAARAMYAGRQFVEVGRRKRYYQHPTEDGLILQAQLSVFTGNPAKSQ